LSKHILKYIFNSSNTLKSYYKGMLCFH